MSKKKNKPKVINLFPSPEVAQEFKQAASDPTLRTLVEVFKKIKNPSELNWLLTQTETELGKLLSETVGGIVRSPLNIAWQRIDTFAPVLELFIASSSPPDSEIAYEEPSSLTPEQNEVGKQAGRQWMILEQEVQSQAQELGFKLVSSEFVRPQILLDHLHANYEDSKAFEPFKELESEFQSMWDSFSETLKERDEPHRMQVSRDAISRIGKLWRTLIINFESAWVTRAEAQKISESAEGKESPVEADAIFGHLIGDANYLAGLEILEPNRTVLFTDFMREGEQTLQELIGLSGLEKVSSVLEHGEDALVQVLESSVSTSGAYRRSLIMGSGEGLTTANRLLGLACMMPPSVRALFIRSKLQCEDQKNEILSWEIAVALLTYTDAAIGRWLTQQTDMRDECTEKMRKSSLVCKPLSDEDYLLSSRSLYFQCKRGRFWEDDAFWREIFIRQQQIVASRVSRGFNPWWISPDNIENPGMFVLGDIPGNDIYAHGLWCAVELLESFSFQYASGNYERWDGMCRTLERLERDGYSRLGYRLLNACLWREFLVKMFATDEAKLNRHAPLGPWSKIREAFDFVKSQAGNEILRKTCRHFAEWFNSRNMAFAAVQLLEVSGIGAIDNFNTEEKPPVVDLSLIQKMYLTSDSTTIGTKSRIIELMGESSWNFLSEDLRRQIIGIERMYEISQSDRTLAGPRPEWIVSYAKLFEGRITHLLNPILKDAKFARQLSNSYSAVRPNEVLSDRPSLQQRLDILRGAAKIGADLILSALKEAGADPYELGNKWATDYAKNVSPIRNKAAHTEGVLTESEIDAFRIWVFKNLPSFIDACGH